MKMQYTEEQIARANQTDLVSFLNAQGEQLVKSGREYRWKKHDSVTISGNRWYRHSQSKGGYPVDFVMEFYYATFPEAVKILIGPCLIFSFCSGISECGVFIFYPLYNSSIVLYNEKIMQDLSKIRSYNSSIIQPKK